MSPLAHGGRSPMFSFAAVPLDGSACTAVWKPGIVGDIKLRHSDGIETVLNLTERLHPMPDEHQTNTIIATAILDSFKDHPDRQLDPEEAKIVAKRILTALEEAGFQIALSDQSKNGSPLSTGS
jgi:hypothetical protein